MNRKDVFTPVRALMVMASGLCAASLLSACVPIPYKPAVTLQHDAVTPEASPAIILKTEPPSAAGKIGKQLKRAEPRIVFVDVARVLPEYREFTLPDAIAALEKLPPGADTPDYLLGLSTFSEESVPGGTDLYTPLFGYVKDKYVAHRPSLLVELRTGRPADAMDFKSEYSSVLVQVFYGIMTVPEGETAVDNALVAEIARRLQEAHPQGPIRVLVMFQRPRIVT